MTEFVPFPKIARLSREFWVSEKIDGTNASIFIGEDGEFLVGSRTQWITPERDNHGFARWAYEHRDELMTLGPGSHMGEFWGSGIQRGYGLQKGEKRFSLFNVRRWCLHGTEPARVAMADPRIEKFQDVLPPCCGLVPILATGNFMAVGQIVESVMATLEADGSRAAPGFARPEGIVAWHVAGNVGFKKTFDGDGERMAW